MNPWSLQTLSQISSAQPLNQVQLFATHGLQHTRLPCPSPTPGACPNSYPSNWWCHPTISFCRLLLLPPSIFPSIRVFSNESALASGGQSTGVSASTSVLPMNIQDWFPLGYTGWISLRSQGVSRVFSNTAVQKRQFFIVQLSHPYMATGKKHSFDWSFKNGSEPTVA